MSFQLTTARKDHISRPAWANVAFIVEAMLLLVFLIASLAVFMQLFSVALERSEQGGTMTKAVAVGSAVAEEFAAYPEDVQAVTELDGMVVTCDIDKVERTGGTMYYADIAVYNQGEAPASSTGAGAASASATTTSSGGSDQGAIYTISTSVYVSEVS